MHATFGVATTDASAICRFDAFPLQGDKTLTTAFAAALDMLFADPNLGVDAVYRAGGVGPGVPIRVIVRQPDRIGTFGETRIAAATTTVDVRVAEVAAPAAGDAIEVDGTAYVVQGEPVRDAARLLWTAELRPA